MARKQRRKAGARSPKPSKPGEVRCGLCGKSGRLIRTECCGQWICDDEDSYQMFSYARNSCSRNHSRYTLCGFHHVEGHEGRWQDCSVCRNEFETEIFVYYGTNEYNFERLANPPKYAPTLCSKCGSRIALGEGGYSQKGDEYWCVACSDTGLRHFFAQAEDHGQSEGDA